MTDPKAPDQRGESQEQEWYKRTRYQVLMFAGGIVIFFLVVGWILDWYINPHSSGQKKDLVQALGLITAGVAGAGGIYFAWGNLSNARNQFKSTQDSTNEQLALTRKGQVTDRFTKSIDQLGATDDGKKQLEIRLGGIYALEQIARDEVQYYAQIIEILTAYIRENAPWPPKDPSLQPSAEQEADEWEKWTEEWGSTIPLSMLSRVPADIQAILDVLARRNEDQVPMKYRTDLLLQGADLRGAVLTGVNLAGATFDEANLQGAWLLNTNLESSSLANANLQRAYLAGARLKGAYLNDARLEGATLTELQMSDLSISSVSHLGLDDKYLGGEISLPAVDLQEVIGLAPEQLELTIGSTNIELPGLEQPDMWSRYENVQRETVKERMKKQVFRPVT